MTILTLTDDTISTQPYWVVEGNIGSKVKINYTFEFTLPEILNNSQVKQSRIERITKNITKLYQNNIAQYTMVYWTKLYQEWTSYYNRIKMTILGEK